MMRPALGLAGLIASLMLMTLVPAGAQAPPGCVLTESWTSVRGTTGASLNFVDPDTGNWRQLWIGVNNKIDYTGGPVGSGQMRLEGEITYFSSEGAMSAPFRGQWTALENGHVIQHFQQYDDDAGAWRDWFVGTYVPSGSDPNGPRPDAGAMGPVITEPPAFE